MALGSNPGRDQIWAELIDSNYRNGGVNVNGLNDMSNYVFGAGSYSRDAFGGYGRPSALITTAANIEDTEVDLRINITGVGGLTTSFYFEYWEGNQSRGDAGTIFTTGDSSTTTTGIKSIHVTSLDPSTTYTYQGIYWNKFTNFDNQVTPSTEVFTTDAFTLATPSITQFFANSRSSWHVEWNDNNGADADDFDARYREQGTATWNTSGSFMNKVNWGTTSNPKEGNWGPGVSYGVGDTIEFQIRAFNSAHNVFSSWSSTAVMTI